MTERSIAEIIGWRLRPVDSGETRMDWAPEPYGFADGVPPTVDDLLAWLASQGWCTDIEYLIDHPTPVLVTLRSNTHPVTVETEFPMNTSVLAALEQAVRAVAEVPS